MEDERLLYRAALSAVAEHAGLQPETLMSRHHPPRWVGAMRWVFYRLLEERGLTRTGIARLSHKGFHAVSYALDRWPERAASPMPDPEEEAETYAEALDQCRVRMNELLQLESE